MKSKASADLLTPPMSPRPSPKRTMCLKLEIPGHVITQNEERMLKIRRAAALRWVPKLQRPFPRPHEIKEAYKCKLLRHYTDPSVPALPDFIKPRIDTSPRVDILRKRFPLLSTSSDASAPAAREHGAKIPREDTEAEQKEIAKHRKLLWLNKRITRSESAQRLAWHAFSSREKDRIDRGREAMMRSGLWEHDLDKESMGVANGLPEWRKKTTGRFAKPKKDAAKGPSTGESAAKRSAP
ncbi:hypothetical protein BDW02DRAFT_545049 [Decorospora gaudefroyi]|uniref:Uncharacterized protein n=1 Tax=Decorospora gaudefroyi TaxID=184978 RepID=A0A6A5KPE0_9PLEO|nr:hypothetical protein BDW02DRAFT_545049 [Decorospora gaudefroyi]